MFAVVILSLVVAVFALGAYPLQRVAQSTSDQRDDAIYAWCPVLNTVLLCRIAGMSAWWTLLLLMSIVPLFGFLTIIGFQVVLWVKIGTRFHRPGLGWLAGLLPIIGGWVLAFNIKTETAAY
jgi:Family of unknown function (DUF5684)